MCLRTQGRESLGTADKQVNMFERIREGDLGLIRMEVFERVRMEGGGGTHLLTEMQVGTAMPFSMSLPLNSLFTCLHIRNERVNAPQL